MRQDITFESQIRESERRQLSEKYNGWIKVAICPQCDGSGAYYCGGTDEEPDVCQCQFCDYKKQLLATLSPTDTLEDNDKQ